MSDFVPLRHAAEVTLGRMRNPESETGPLQVPYLRAANVSDGVLNLDDVKSMHFSEAEQGRYVLLEGDVLVTEASGSRAQVGQTAMWDGSLPQVMFQNTLMRLRPLPGTDARFLYWWSQHAYAAGVYAKAAQGLAIWHLSADRLRALPFPALSLQEQADTARFLDVQVTLLDKAIVLRKRQADLLAERRSSLVVAAITGDLDLARVSKGGQSA